MGFILTANEKKAFDTGSKRIFSAFEDLIDNMDTMQFVRQDGRSKPGECRVDVHEEAPATSVAPARVRLQMQIKSNTFATALYDTEIFEAILSNDQEFRAALKTVYKMCQTKGQNVKITWG